MGRPNGRAILDMMSPGHATGLEQAPPGARVFHGPSVRGSVHAMAAHPQGTARPKVVTNPRN